MFTRKTAARIPIDCLIGAETRITGDVCFAGGLRIDGHVRGDVVSSDEAGGLLVVGEHGRIDGDVVVGHLIVAGCIRGAVTVAGMLDLQPKAQVSGEVHYRAIELARGAVLEGIVSHFDGDLVRPSLRLAAARRPPADVPAAVAQEAG